MPKIAEWVHRCVVSSVGGRFEVSDSTFGAASIRHPRWSSQGGDEADVLGSVGCILCMRERDRQ